MTTLQKFKLLATQCAVAGSPTRSPATSPVIHLRRRKTLRMLLSRGGGGCGSRRLPAREEFTDRRGTEIDSSDNRKDGSVRRKLKDLLVASPPARGLLEEDGGDGGEEVKRWSVGGGMVIRRGGWRGVRPLSGTLRQRLLRRAWRPVLVSIPE